jgi:hypothetical protein
MTSISQHFSISVGLAVIALLSGAIASRLIGLPLINQADIVEAWFAGRAEFGSEQKQAGGSFVRSTKWETPKPQDCSIKEAAVSITREGSVRFSARVKSKDDGDRYCVILSLFNYQQEKVWTSPKLCTAFELQDQFATWTDNCASFPKAEYPFISYATREDFC